MGYVVKKNIKIATNLESTEGTYVAPSAGTDYLQPEEAGVTLTPTMEMVARKILDGSIGEAAPRLSKRTVKGDLTVECKANAVAGQPADFDVMLQSAMGAATHTVTSTVTKSSGNTGSILQIQDADISKFRVNDIILIKEAGAYWPTPITAVSTGTGTASLTVLIPRPTGVFPNSVVIEAVSQYNVANFGHPSFSMSKWMDDARLETAFGCKVSSMALEKFSTGQIPTMKFAFSGIDFNSSLTALSVQPTYDTSLPPVILDALIYQGGTSIQVNALSMTLANTLAEITATSSDAGTVAQRVSERKVSGSINPYKMDNSIANYTLFRSGTYFSLFAFVCNPSGVAGQGQNYVCFYMPNCMFQDFAEANQGGVLQENLKFMATRGAAGNIDELVIAMI